MCVTLTDVTGFAQKNKEHLAKRERKSSRAKAWKAWEQQELYALTADTLSSDRGANDNHAQAQEHPPSMLIEYCTSEDSMLGVVGSKLGINVVRCTKTENNVEEPAMQGVLQKIVEDNPRTHLWGSLECTTWSQLQNMNSHRESFRTKVREGKGGQPQKGLAVQGARPEGLAR